MDQKRCLHCFEQIPAQANKCRHCLEFQSPSDGSQDKKLEIIKEIFSLAGKSLVPIVILVLVFSFKPTIQTLLSKTNEAEFLGGKFKFSTSSSFSGVLSAYELYYLIYSADKGQDFEGGLNYDLLKKHQPKELEAIESLEQKGLIGTKIKKYEGSNTKVFGENTLAIFSTEVGKALLIEMGISF